MLLVTYEYRPIGQEGWDQYYLVLISNTKTISTTTTIPLCRLLFHAQGLYSVYSRYCGAKYRLLRQPRMEQITRSVPIRPLVFILNSWHGPTLFLE